MSTYEWLVAAQSIAMTLGAGLSFALRRSIKAVTVHEDLRRLTNQHDALVLRVSGMGATLHTFPDRWKADIRLELDRASALSEKEQTRIWNAIDRRRES